MNKKTLLTTARNLGFLTILPGIAVASPVVNGSVISWANDGWYQVQDAHSYATVCEGGTSCIVPDGSYIVINHTTGARLHTEVGTAVTSPTVETTGPSNVTVANGLISWPDDGWYQVQSATSLVTICEGGTSCNVHPGTYNVINLSTGQRHDNVVVGAGTDPVSGPSEGAGSSGITVDGMTISWPNDGWYQVQSIDNFSNVCEGGTSCTVAAGRYQVINLTTGQRFDPITITDSTDSTDSTD